jgi:zinc protease
MTTTRLALLALALATTVANGGFAMEIESGKLANGMEIVVVPDHRAPVVVHSVWYTVGSVDEAKGHTGLSHMLEHMMFKGTEKYPYQVMDKTVQRNGGVQNAFTSRDMTAYHQTITKDKLPLMMDIESDRMEGLNINDKVLTPEKNVVLEERRLRTDSQPQSRFFEALVKAHYPHHPYGNPVIGWKQDIENYKLADVLDWYRRHYAPNNAMLLVVGDTTLKDVEPLAEKYYGKVEPMADVPKRTAHVEPARTAPVWLTHVEKDVQVPVFYRLYRTPSLFQGVAGAKPSEADCVALKVLAEVLGGSDAARLYQSLVVDQNLSDGASSDYDFISGGESTLDIQVTPKPGVTMDKIDAAVKAEVAKMIATPVSEAELARAKINILADTIYGQDDDDNLMWQVGSWRLAGGDVKDFNKWQDALKKVTAADVQRVAKAYLAPAGETTGILVQNEGQLGALKTK